MRIALATVVALALAAASSVQAAPTAVSPAEKRYVVLLRANYVPFRNAWIKITVPCQREDWALCAQRLAASRAALVRLEAALSRNVPPRRLRSADRTLARGVGETLAFVERYLGAVEARDEAAIRAAGCPCTAGADITNAIGEINYLIPSARLPELG